MIKLKWVIITLFSRLIFFISIGVLFLVILYILPIGAPLEEVVKLWPFQVIIGNFLSLILLRWLTNKEGITFFELMNFNKKYIKKDLIVLILGFVPIFIIAYFGLNLTALVIYGGTAPEIMFLSIPLWIVIVSLILIPITNPLVELTTYFAYSFQRIQVLSNKQWLAVLLSSIFLALQHIGFPIILDIRFIIWRFISFVPLAVIMALIYLKVRRLFLFIIGHFVLDLNLVITLLLYTL